MMMAFKKANELPPQFQKQMSEIFVDGWYKDLKIISRDRAKLERAFQHIFSLEDFYVAVVGHQINAFVGISDRKDQRRIVAFDKRELRRHLGFFKGSLANWALRKEMIKRKYPFEIQADTGVIEFVATRTSARGQGLAGKLIAHVMEVEHYKTYVLEVVDTNSGAIKLYERLGFFEFTREKSPYPPKQAGFEYMIYMKREKESKHDNINARNQ